MFDEMRGSEGAVRPAYAELSQWLGEVPPDVLDFRRRKAELFFRRIGITFAVYGEPKAQERLIPFDVIPRIISAAEWQILQRGLEQRVKAINAYIKDVYGRREISKPASCPRIWFFRKSGLSPGDEWAKGAARHLCACRRHRHRARRRRELLRARRQCAHAVRCLLHAGKPQDHAAALSRAVFALPRRAGRELSGRASGDAEIDRTADRIGRADRRAADARSLQFRLLRALVPGRQARRRTGRGPRPRGAGQHRLHAHHRGLKAHRRDLSPDRRRLPRSTGVPARQRARRARPDVGLSGRQRHARQCRRHRHRRRQGGLQLHAGVS